MLHSKVHIEEGDLVIVFFVSLQTMNRTHDQTRDNMTPITITKGQFLHNKYGRYEHDDMVGRKFGTKVCCEPLQRLMSRCTHLRRHPVMFTFYDLLLSYGRFLCHIEHKSCISQIYHSLYRD